MLCSVQGSWVQNNKATSRLHHLVLTLKYNSEMKHLLSLFEQKGGQLTGGAAAVEWII